ncbi:MAG TPA: ABC transporter permease [Mycobacteriales bacterium]|nr:ABC transporter permease [Mycobacteriales bacterium]
MAAPTVDEFSADFHRLHEATTIRRSTGIPFADRLYDVWVRRDVLRMLVDRGLKAKYSSSVLGYAWSLIEPAMFILTYFLLLKIFHRSYPMYPLFVGSTVLAWQWFNGTVTSSLSSLRSNARLITSVNLPREIYPLADAAQKAVEYFLSLPILLVVALLYRATPSYYAILLPLALLLQIMICVGMALLVSALNTVLRDVQRGIGIVLRMMFYLIPVLYPLQRLPAKYRTLEALNPLTGILEMQRAVWFPGYWTGWQPVINSIIGACIVLVGGFSVFARTERTVLKEL